MSAIRGSTASPAARSSSSPTTIACVLSSEQIYLGRALGMSPQVEIDYRPIQLEEATSSCWRPTASTSISTPRVVADAIAANDDDLDGAAQGHRRRGLQARQPRQPHRPDRAGRCAAGRRGRRKPGDRAPTCRCRRCSSRAQRVRRLPDRAQLHGSSRSHVYLAVDGESDETVVLKIPSIDLRGDPAYLKPLHDGGVDRAAHRQRACAASPQQHTRKRNFLYVVTEFVDGQTLRAMDDRQSASRTSRRCAASSSRSRAGCGPSTAWRCCTRTCGPRTS